jgi:hypothetical protein
MFNYKAVFDLLSKENKSLILASLLNGMPDIKSYIGFIIKNQEYLKDTGFSVPVFINDLQYSQVSVAWPFTAVNDEDAVSSKGIEITDDSASVSKVKEHRQVMVSKFVNGTRLVNNPDYRAAELNLEKAKNDLANAQAAQQENDAMAASNTSNSGLGALLSGTGKLLGTAAVDLAQSQVDAAYQKLEDTPQQIEKENVQSYSFPVTKTTYQKKLILSMMFRGIGKFGEKAATTESVSSVDISTPEGLSDTDIKFKPADFSGENDLENFENKKDTVILSSDTLPTLTFNEGQAGNKTSGGNSLLNSKLAASPAQPANHTSSVQVSGSNPGGTSDQSETSLDQPETSLDQSLSISRNTSMTTSRAFPYTGHGAEAARRLLTDVGGWPRSSPLQIAASTQRDTLIAAAVVQAWGAEAEAQQGAMQKAAQMAATMHANLKSAYSLLSVGSKPDNSGNIITETELASLADSY